MWRGTQGPQNLKVSGKRIVYVAPALFYVSHCQGGKWSQWSHVSDDILSKLINVNVSVVVRYVCLHTPQLKEIHMMCMKR